MSGNVTYPKPTRNPVYNACLYLQFAGLEEKFPKDPKPNYQLSSIRTGDDNFKTEFTFETLHAPQF